MSSNAYIFDYDATLFSVIHNLNTAADELKNNVLVIISNWAYQWKMSFNSDLNKETQEVTFSRKIKKKKAILFCILTIAMYQKVIHKSIYASF